MKMTSSLMLLVTIFILNTTFLHSDVGNTWVDEVKKGGWLAIRTSRGYPIEVLLIDFKDRRTGWIKEEKKEVAEIPWSAYSTQVQPNLSGPDSPPCREIEIMYPEMGKYTLYVIGVKEDIYCVSISGCDKNYNDFRFYIDGIISKGDVHQIELYYSSDYAIFKTTAKKVVNLNLLEKELKLAIKHKYIEKNLGKELIKKLKKFSKTYKSGKPDRSILESFVSQIEIEKQKYKERYKDYPRIEYLEFDIPEYAVLKLLVDDANILKENLK